MACFQVDRVECWPELPFDDAQGRVFLVLGSIGGVGCDVIGDAFVIGLVTNDVFITPQKARDT